MNADILFSIFNTGVLLPWLLMLVAPKWQLTQRLLDFPIFPLLLGTAYLILLIMGLVTGFGAESGGAPLDFSSLDGVHAMFSKKEAVLVGWIHYLAFDLFIGMWELKDSQKNQIGHIWMVPCLIMTLMFGPVGLLLYWGIRSVKTQRLGIDA